MSREDRMILREMDTAMGALNNMSIEDKEYYNTLSDTGKRAYLTNRYREARNERIARKLLIRTIIVIGIIYIIKLWMN